MEISTVPYLLKILQPKAHAYKSDTNNNIITQTHTHTHKDTHIHSHTRHHLQITCHQNTHTKKLKIKPLELHLLSLSLPTHPDKIKGEMLKHANDVVIDSLVTLFNKLFDHGMFPQEWSKSIIVPIHKKGDVNQPDNYRGIALTSVISKVYTHIFSTKHFQSGLSWKERLLRNKLVSEQVIALWTTYLLSMRLYKNFYSSIQNCM